MEETAALSEVHKRVLCILEEVLNCGFKSDACLRTQRRLSLFSLSLFPFYFLFLCRLIDLLLPLLTSHKGDIWEESKSEATKQKLHFFYDQSGLSLYVQIV